MKDELIRAGMERHQSVVAQVQQQLSGAIAQAAGLMTEVLKKGGKVLVMGNGGSAADAQHLAAELVGRFLKNRAALPSVALTTDSSILTAVGNDFGFDQIFARQVEALGAPGDLVIGISTSGNSPNVVEAFKTARAKGCSTLGLLGGSGGAIRDMVDLPLVVPSSETPRIQEVHSLIIHILCDLVERSVFPD